MKTTLINACILMLCINTHAQSTMDQVLSDIRKNNKTLQATVQYYEARNLEYKTGLTPPNPFVEYDFLKGTPAAAGNQHDFSVVQQFDFPTAYSKKSQLAKSRSAQSELEITASRQDILFEAKKVCIALVYHNKLHTQLTQQLENNSRLLADFQTRLDKGDGNMLDLSKARLQWIETKSRFQENVSAINELNIKLTELNGGTAVVFADTSYAVPPAIPEFAQLEKDYEQADPLLKILQQKKQVSQKELELGRSMALPKLEFGYHYQGILGQAYNGIHTGFSIPLWENKNTTKQRRAQLLFSDLQLTAHANEHYYHIKHIYERYSNLKITLQEYEKVFGSLGSTTLLSKALKLGEISTIQYFMELNYYTQARENFLQTEKEYHEVIAELFKYQL